MTSHSICTFLLRDFTQENYFRETDRLTILIWYEVLLWHSQAFFTILFDAFLKVWTFQLLIWLICGFSNCIWSCLLFPRLVFAFCFKYILSLFDCILLQWGTEIVFLEYFSWLFWCVDFHHLKECGELNFKITVTELFCKHKNVLKKLLKWYLLQSSPESKPHGSDDFSKTKETVF